MGPIITTGGAPPTQDEQDRAAARAAIIAAALNAGAAGINISDLVANLTSSLPTGQAQYVTQASVRLLCVAPNRILTLEQGTTIRHRNAPVPALMEEEPEAEPEN